METDRREVNAHWCLFYTRGLADQDPGHETATHTQVQAWPGSKPGLSSTRSILRQDRSMPKPWKGLRTPPPISSLSIILTALYPPSKGSRFLSHRTNLWELIQAQSRNQRQESSPSGLRLPDPFSLNNCIMWCVPSKEGLREGRLSIILMKPIIAPSGAKTKTFICFELEGAAEGRNQTCKHKFSETGCTPDGG